MKCPKCEKNGLKQVLDSRSNMHGNGVRRRRKCGHCDHRWSTLEVQVDLAGSHSMGIVIIKRDKFRAIARRMMRMLLESMVEDR